jgi:hypothetical protein
MAKFCSAKQEDTEDVTQWSCRLEDILGRVMEQGLISHYDSNEMLRSEFWAGLRQDLKDTLGFKYEMVKDFDKLRVELRKIEREHKLPAKDTKRTTNMVCVPESHNARQQQESEIAESKHLVKDMAIKMSHMGRKLSDLKEEPSNARSNLPRNNTQARGRPKFRSSYNPTPRKPGFSDIRGRNFPVNSGPKGRCYRCRQYDHYQW